MFDLKAFLSKHNIPFRERGENVAKGNININCVFCIKSGRGDEKFHMGIEPNKGVYGCWRNNSHRGKKLEKVVRALINCSYEEAHKLVYGTVLIERLVDEDIMSVLNRIYNKSEVEAYKPQGVKELELLPSFIEIRKDDITGKFYQYLVGRGFGNVDALIKKYSLLCCLNGEYADRIIFPIFYDGELVTWSSRSLEKNAYLRYRDLEVDKSVIHVKQLVYNYDKLIKGGNILFLTEGLFDCIKLDYYLSIGNHSTCSFTKHITDNQADQLLNLSIVFNRIIVLMDSDASPESINIMRRLANKSSNIDYRNIEIDRKDPGEFTKQEVKDFELTIK